MAGVASASSAACIPCATTTTTTTARDQLLPSLVVLKPKITSGRTTCLPTNYNHVTLTPIGKPVIRRFLIRNSEADAGTTTTTTEEGDDKSPVMELPKGPPSLISALNVEKALRGIPITDVDHYARLGLSMGCSFDQVKVAYENKVNQLSSQGLDQEEYDKKLELLKESYTILSSEDERRLYDWSLARSERPERYVWPFEVDITQTPKGTPPPGEPEDVGPTRLVGYFLLGWIVLAFALSIGFNL